jgi:hypothetical protein
MPKVFVGRVGEKQIKFHEQMNRATVDTNKFLDELLGPWPPVCQGQERGQGHVQESPESHRDSPGHPCDEAQPRCPCPDRAAESSCPAATQPVCNGGRCTREGGQRTAGTKHPCCEGWGFEAFSVDQIRSTAILWVDMVRSAARRVIRLKCCTHLYLGHMGLEELPELSFATIRNASCTTRI